MSDKLSKAAQDRNERILNDLAKQNGNDRCADCNAKNPRWASYSLGIFLCIRCAGIHRKMGTHISKVKSITMDQWSSEQIEMMRKAGGNIAVNSKMNPHPDRHPLPLATDDEHAMEKYIRAKWEKRAFLVNNKVIPPSKPATANPISRLQALPKRSSSVPIISSSSINFPTKLSQLQQMGFIDEMKNRQVLIQTQGNIEAAIEILSRAIPQHINSSLQQPNMTDEQKLKQLSSLGFMDTNANRDALCRAGGNIDIAITILKEMKNTMPYQSQSFANGVFPPVQLQKSASVITSMNSNSNTSSGLLIDTSSFTPNATSVNPTTANPFSQVQQSLAQQYQSTQQLPTADLFNDPFNLNMNKSIPINNTFGENPQATLHNTYTQQPLITPQTVAQQHQQPRMNSSNPFSQMANPLNNGNNNNNNMNATFPYPAANNGGYNPVGQSFSIQQQPQYQQQQQQQQQSPFQSLNTWPTNGSL